MVGEYLIQTYLRDRDVGVIVQAKEDDTEVRVPDDEIAEVTVIGDKDAPLLENNREDSRSGRLAGSRWRAEDRLRIYRLAGPPERHVKVWGVALAHDVRKPLIL